MKRYIHISIETPTEEFKKILSRFVRENEFDDIDIFVHDNDEDQSYTLAAEDNTQGRRVRFFLPGDRAKAFFESAMRN